MLTAYGPDAKKAVDESIQRLNELTNMASPNIGTSDISKINNVAGKDYVKVHPEIINMLVTSQKYSELSGGLNLLTWYPHYKIRRRTSSIWTLFSFIP